MSLIYDIVKVPVYLTHTGYFRKVHVINAHNVPLDKPVLLLPNHPNAFLDAIVVSINIRQQVNFLVRSDVFNTPFKRWFLKKLNNYPIYRIQEGVENLVKNEETFRLCSELFRQNKTILIFPEGICIREKRLRKLKKGAARIALGSEEQSGFTLDLQLVPVGINYSRFGELGGDLIINYGKPFSLAEYKEPYSTEKAKTINDLTAKIENELSKLVIAVPTQDEDLLFDRLETIRLKRRETGFDKFSRKKHITFRLAAYRQTDPERLEKLKQRSEGYFSKLDVIGTTDPVVAGFSKWSFTDNIKLILTAPLCLIGFILNLIPYRLSYSLSNKLVKKEEFFDSVNMIGGMFIFLVYYTIIGIVISFLNDSGYYTLFAVLSIPLSGIIALWWRRMWRRRKAVSNFRRLNHESRERLIKQRDEILTILNLQL